MAAVDSSSSSTTLLLRMPYTYMLHLAGLIAAMWSCPGTAAFGVLASRMPIQQQQPRNPLMSPLLPGRQFSSSSSLLSSSSYAAAAGCCRRRHHHHHPRYAKNDSGEDEENDCSSQQQPGMDEAFRLLDSMLRSMDDDEPPPLPATASSETDKQQRPLNAAVNKIDVTALDRSALVLESSSVVQSVSPEKEIAVYKLMMEELEQNVDAEAYAEVLDDLGSTVMKDDVYSQVLTDLLGATSKRPTPATPAPIAAATTTVSDPPSILSGTTSSSSPSTEQFMQVALQEALQQVRVNNPRMNDSILDDKEIMKEIEGIFEQGNEKLMASLEEIRQEQVRGCAVCLYVVLVCFGW